MPNALLLPSPMESLHLELGAKLAEFVGWNMPIQYTGALKEHQATRNHVGIFDISHMGEIKVSGSRAKQWLNTVLSNDLEKLQMGFGQYSLLLNDQGGIIDDLFVYLTTDGHYWLIVNASNLQTDWQHLKTQNPASYQVKIENLSNQFAAMAVQGPKSISLLSQICPQIDIPPRQGFVDLVLEGEQILLCRTGYTGEDGFEWICPSSSGKKWFAKFVEAGGFPCGLAARDSLRLESGYHLHGSDLDETINPFEAGLKWAVGMNKDHFVGREALLKIDTISKKFVGLVCDQKGPIPRANCKVLNKQEQVIGELTSGGFSPRLGVGIGLTYLPISLAKLGSEVWIEIRGKNFLTKVSKKPFGC